MRVPVSVLLAAASNHCTASFLLPYIETSINSVDRQCYYHVSPNNAYGNAVVTRGGYLCAGVGGGLAGTRADLKCVGDIWGGIGAICTAYNDPDWCLRRPSASHSVKVPSGNLHIHEIDLEGEIKGEASLKWERHYNSLLPRMGGAGLSSHWTHSFSYSLQLVDPTAIWVLRPDGRMFGASFPGLAADAGPQRWTINRDVAERVYQQYDASLSATGWQIVAADGSVEDYDDQGNLVSIKDGRGDRARHARCLVLVRRFGPGDAGKAAPAVFGQLNEKWPEGIRYISTLCSENA
jgi:hypothetical protein